MKSEIITQTEEGLNLISTKLMPASPEAAKAQRDFIFFSEWVFNHKNQPFHLHVLEVLLKKVRNQAVLLPRRNGKTTIITKLILWLLGRNRNLRIWVVSKAQSQAKDILRAVEGTMVKNERYREVFGNLVPQNKETTWTDSEKVVLRTAYDLKDPSLRAIGSGGSVLNRRADVIVVDDLLSISNSATAYLRSKLSEWFWLELMPVLEPDGKIIVLGTRFSDGDLYSEFIEKWGSDNVLIYRTPGADGKAIWEEEYPLDLLNSLREQMGPILFDLVYINAPSSLALSHIREENFSYWDHWPEEAVIVQGIDPASSTKGSADFFVIATLAYANNKAYLIDLFRTKIHPSQCINAIKLQAEKWKPQVINIEADAGQIFLTQLIQEKTALPIRKSTSRNIPKELRFIRIASDLESGRLLLPHRDSRITQEFLKELLSFPRGEYDDILDAVDKALELVEFRTPARGTVALPTPSISAPRRHEPLFPHSSREPFFPRR